MTKKLDYKSIVIKIFAIILYIVALYISSGNTRLAMGVFLGVAIITLFLNKKIRVIYISGLLFVSILFGIYASLKNDSDIMFYHVYDQSLYVPQFSKENIYPDIYVRELVEDKTVIVPNEIQTYSDYQKKVKKKPKDGDFINMYFKENNYSIFFKEYAGCFEVDSSMPGVIQMMEEELVDLDEFESLGCANDMLRYSFLVNRENIEEASFFWYSWYYYSFSTNKGWYPSVYICKENMDDKDTLVALWDKQENLFLMSLEYYNEKVKK